MDQSFIQIQNQCFLRLILLAFFQVYSLLHHFGHWRNFIRFTLFYDFYWCIDMLYDQRIFFIYSPHCFTYIIYSMSSRRVWICVNWLKIGWLGNVGDQGCQFFIWIFQRNCGISSVNCWLLFFGLFLLMILLIVNECFYFLLHRWGRYLQLLFDCIYFIFKLIQCLFECLHLLLFNRIQVRMSEIILLSKMVISKS